MGLLLAVFQLFLIVMARSIQRSGSFERMSALIPPFARELLGPSLTSFMSFSGIVCLGYFHLAVVGSLLGISIVLGTTPTAEMEIGFTDLILSRPLARHWIITRSTILLVAYTAGLLMLMLAGTAMGLRALAPQGALWPAPRVVLSLAANLGLLMLCWGGVALAIGAAARRRSVAGGLAGLLALATFLLDYVARAWRPAEAVAWLSPFHYHSPLELLRGAPLPARNVAVLAGIAVAGVALAYLFFSRRDLPH